MCSKTSCGRSPSDSIENSSPVLTLRLKSAAAHCMNALEAFLKANGKSWCVSGVHATGLRNLKTPSKVPTKTRSRGGARGPSILAGDPREGDAAGDAAGGTRGDDAEPVTYLPRTLDQIVCTANLR